MLHVLAQMLNICFKYFDTIGVCATPETHTAKFERTFCIVILIAAFRKFVMLRTPGNNTCINWTLTKYCRSIIFCNNICKYWGNNLLDHDLKYYFASLSQTINTLLKGGYFAGKIIIYRFSSDWKQGWKSQFKSRACFYPCHLHSVLNLFRILA